MHTFRTWAPKPPLGYAGGPATEAIVEVQAEYMATHLAPLGWTHLVVGSEWYASAADQATSEVAIDAHGRPLPAPSRFPSCAEGFASLGASLHARGLVFGLRLPRGIPRAAVAANLPVLGCTARAADIALTSETSSMMPLMVGIDLSKPAAQAYYDSLFAALAQWGVDYVQVDDIACPYREREVEAIRRAIDRCGRPIVLGLAGGPTPLAAAEHSAQHANLVRIGGQPPSSWDDLLEQLARLREWNEQRAPGFWPDAGPLPLAGAGPAPGSASFSSSEWRLLLTLWAIARCPLMYPADMTRMDADTRALLTNRAVLEVNQESRANRPLFERDGVWAWLAQSTSGDATYLALFNARDEPFEGSSVLAAVELRGGEHAFQTDLIDIPVMPGTVIGLAADGGFGGEGEHLALVWGEAVLRGPGGETSIGELPWEPMPRSGEVTIYQAREASDLLLGGRPVDSGLIVQTPSRICFRVPAGYERLITECGFAGSALPQASSARVRCVVYGATPGGGPRPGSGSGVGETPRVDETPVDSGLVSAVAGAGTASPSVAPSGAAAHRLRPLGSGHPGSRDRQSEAAEEASEAAEEASEADDAGTGGLDVSIELARLGISGRVRVRDLWSGRDLGVFEGVFSRSIPWHGAGLFRIEGGVRRL
jgi:alpha-galactosidase